LICPVFGSCSRHSLQIGFVVVETCSRYSRRTSRSHFCNLGFGVARWAGGPITCERLWAERVPVRSQRSGQYTIKRFRKSDLGTPFGATHTGSTGAPSVAATKTSTTVSKTNHIAGAKASSNLYQSDRTSVRGSRFGQPKNHYTGLHQYLIHPTACSIDI
jgi:hypothetical protein